MMEFIANEGKKVEIEVDGACFLRHVIQTKFIQRGEDYFKILEEYVSPIYQKGDILASCEKIVSLCQNRVIERKEIKVGILAKTLSKFASHPKEKGIGVGESIKMQYAINKVGTWRVLFASFCSFVTKMFGIKGVFYKMVGQEVSGLDGFYGDVWEEYENIGIEIPKKANEVCNEAKERLGISMMIMDANDFGVEILRKIEGYFVS